MYVEGLKANTPIDLAEAIRRMKEGCNALQSGRCGFLEQPEFARLLIDWTNLSARANG